MSIIRLQNLLKGGNDDGLGKLVRKAQDMERLTLALKSGLDREFRPHLVAANLRTDGLLVAVVDSSAWAARFRYEADRLLRLARADGSRVLACRIVVTKDRSSSVIPESSSTSPPGAPAAD
jgi:hypothetical protein